MRGFLRNMSGGADLVKRICQPDHAAALSSLAGDSPPASSATPRHALFFLAFFLPILNRIDYTASQVRRLKQWMKHKEEGASACKLALLFLYSPVGTKAWHFHLKLLNGACIFPAHRLKSWWKHKCGRLGGAGNTTPALRECLHHSTQQLNVVPQAHYIHSLSVFQGGMGVVCCVRIDLFKAVLGFSKLDAAFMFPAGAKGGGAVPRRLLDNIL